MDTKPHTNNTHRRPRSHTRSDTRSRSPTRHSHSHPQSTHTHTHRHRHRHSRSRSPSHNNHNHHHSRHHRSRSPPHPSRKRARTPSPAPLPFNAPPLSRHTSATGPIAAIFREYLDIQKGLHLDSLPEREAKGRYKRFVSHYNRGELARGWYERVVKESRGPATSVTVTAGNGAGTSTAAAQRKPEEEKKEEEDSGSSSEDEVVGPFLPGKEPKRKAGVARPTFEDLELQKAQTAADRTTAHEAARAARKAERLSRAALLDELAPRADAGTFARRLEKRADARLSRRAASPGDGGAEVDDSVLLGGGGADDDGGVGGTEGFKLKKAALERKKNDRELRKEQLLQARIAEREERMAMHRVKEERTMAMLKTLAGRFQ